MGTIRHHNVVITCNDYAEDKILLTHRKATELFGDLVSPIVITETNGYFSFFIATDGSKKNWGESDKGILKRKELCDFIDSFADDDSNPVRYVDVAYGDDDDGYHTAYIGRTNPSIKYKQTLYCNKCKLLLLDKKLKSCPACNSLDLDDRVVEVDGLPRE